MFTSGDWAQPGVFHKPNGAPGYQFYKTQGEHLYVYHLITQAQGKYDIAYNTLSKTWQTASGVTQPGEVLQFENTVTVKSNPGDIRSLGVFINPYYVAPLVRYGGPNLVSAMPSVVVDRNASFKTFSVASYFNTTKLPASALRYYYSINNDALVSINEADQDGGTFNIVPRGTIGVALVTVRAVALERDVDTWVAETSFNVTIVVDDDDPTVTKAFPNVYASQVINLSNYFKDTDDDLTYTVTVSDASVVTAAITGTSLSLEDATSADGTAAATVTVTAHDSNAEASSSITIDFAFSPAYQFADHVALRSAVDACIQAVPSGIGCYAANPNICGVGVNCGEIGTWDVSQAISMTNLFRFADAFNADISAWNTAAVTSMINMFYGAHAFNADISAWNTAAVTDMARMFYDNYAFNADISAWNTAAVTVMKFMFFNAATFNQNIGAWDVSAVTENNMMFSGAKAWNAVYYRSDGTGNGPPNQWITKSTAYRFPDRTTLKSAVDACINAVPSGIGCYAANPKICGNEINCGEIGTWDVSPVTDMTSMFFKATAFNADISGWNTAAVTDMYYMFNRATAFNADISAWNTARVTNMHGMFFQAIVFDADISGWSTPAVTRTDNMFLEASAWNNKFSRAGNGFAGPPDAWTQR
jgi:surface protein